jgi:hypothetical protein
MGSLMGGRVASLLAASGMAVGMVALAVCIAGFLSSYANESEGSAVFAMVHAARPVHAVPDGHRHKISRSATPVFAEETETKDELPANAGLLTALLLGSFFGAIPWELNSAALVLPVPRSSWPASCSFYSAVCFLQKRLVAILSGVFTL